MRTCAAGSATFLSSFSSPTPGFSAALSGRFIPSVSGSCHSASPASESATVSAAIQTQVERAMLRPRPRFHFTATRGGSAAVFQQASLQGPIQPHTGPLQRFARAVGGDGPEHDIADHSLSVDKKSGGRAEHAVGPLHLVVEIEGDREDDPRFPDELHGRRAPILDGDSQHRVAVSVRPGRERVEHGHLLAAGTAPTRKEAHDQGPASELLQADGLAIERPQIEAGCRRAHDRGRALSGRRSCGRRRIRLSRSNEGKEYQCEGKPYGKAPRTPARRLHSTSEARLSTTHDSSPSTSVQATSRSFTETASTGRQAFSFARLTCCTGLQLLPSGARARTKIWALLEPSRLSQAK